MKPITAMIADDEAPLRDELKTRLHTLWPELQVCAEADNGDKALRIIEDSAPDVAFLDVRMPGLTGMDVANRIRSGTHVVFISGHDTHAVEAFSHDPVDYLLKPVTEDRLQETVKRLRSRLSGGALDLDTVVEKLERITTPPPGPDHLQWIRVHIRDGIRIIAVPDVCCFRSEAKYTSVYTEDGVYMIRKPIKELAAELDPEVFWQIHRGTIINAHFIDKISHSVGGRYAVKVRHVDEILLVSRRYTGLFRQM